MGRVGYGGMGPLSLMVWGLRNVELAVLIRTNEMSEMGICVRQARFIQLEWAEAGKPFGEWRRAWVQRTS
jgi:hypothetical protein